ncbi:MAG TPA: hypothetical protein VHD32_13770 [Candidatus Didemnitutus sp.]|nr:hypothetical protein [Candidatus Didemnitutus sp.]
MNSRRTVRLWTLLAVLAVAAATEAALVVGSTAYATGVSTNVMREPHTVAGAGGTLAGKLNYRQQVRIDKVDGKWLHITAAATTGWVFSGNLTDTLPAEVKNSNGYGLNASQTSVSAASRGLSEGGNDYANRHNLGQARVDLDWLNKQTAAMTDAEVTAYLKEHKKGEYQ